MVFTSLLRPPAPPPGQAGPPTGPVTGTYPDVQILGLVLHIAARYVVTRLAR